MENIKVLIVEAKNKNRKLISDTLSKVDYIELVGKTDDLEEVNTLLKTHVPDVVLLGSDFKFDRYMIANYISSEFPKSAAIMIENELKEDTMSKAIFGGAKDVLIIPFTSAELLDSIYRAFQLGKAKSLFPQETTKEVEEDEITKAEKSKKKKPKKNRDKGQVITVFSTKGGVGKTFISINLAAALAKNSNDRVCLLDLDLDFGNASLALDVIPSFTITDIVDDISNIDENLIETYLVDHEAGFKFLAANAKPLTNEFITAEHIEVIFKALQGAFDYIVVDMPARFYEPVNPTFQVTDLLLMITTPEIATIRNTKSAIKTLKELNFPSDKLKLILNKADNRAKIRPKDVETTIEHKLYSVIDANYKSAMLSLNTGVPIVLSSRRGISRSLTKLAKQIITDIE